MRSSAIYSAAAAIAAATAATTAVAAAVAAAPRPQSAIDIGHPPAPLDRPARCAAQGS